LNIQPNVSASKVVKTSVALVYGGGGYYGEPSKSSYIWYARFITNHMWPGILSRLLRRPYIVMGVGFGPLSNWLVRKVGMFVINGAKAVSVRDEESRAYLKRYGYKKKIHVVPDSALSLGINNSDLDSNTV